MAIGMGIIGAGAIGNIHADAAIRAGLRVVGAWDVRPERGSALATRVGGKPAASIDELLAMPEVDAVAIAVPNDMHCECACRALAARKHVLLEKPMALDTAQCDLVLGAHRASGCVLQIGFVCRGTPAALAVKKFIDAGRFGNIHHIKAAIYRRRGIPGLGGWFTQKKHAGGGSLIDLGVHVLDLALHLAGHPRVRRASGAVWSVFGSPIDQYRFTEMWAGPPKLDGVFDVEDGATALLRCDGGLTIELNATWAANIPDNALRDGICVWGEKAGAHFEVFGKSASIATEEEGVLVDIAPKFNADDPIRQAWDTQYAQFIAAVSRGEAEHATGQSGRDLQAAIDAIYRSERENQEVAV